MNQVTQIQQPLRVALVGNPNSGKTALFNALTGSRQRVANYAGVTVERKEGGFTTPGGRRISMLDLPGTYSLRARSPDEAVTRDTILGAQAGERMPDLLVCVLDATNPRLSLRLVLELKRTGRPMLLALNMFDIARHRGIEIDIEGLSAALGLPVVTSVAVRRTGTEALLAKLDALAPPASPAADQASHAWTPPDAAELRALQREADRILAATVRLPRRPDTLTNRLDAVLLHPVAGLLILLAVLFLMFQAVFSWAEPAMDLIEAGFEALGGATDALLPDTGALGLLRSFLHDGLISGVGSVLVFLPQILILFLFILLLEDFGYMARAAFLMDRIMGGAGLHGRAFIPLLSSFACAIPGIMATRVIDSRRDRLATILVAPLMTCSARIPVYTLIIGAFIPNRPVGEGLLGWVGLQGLVMFGLYALGIVSALGMSFVFRRLFWRRTPTEPFMLELPDYKLPRPRNIALGLWQRAVAFLRRAGTIILAMMIVVWFLASVPPAPEDATEPAIDYSLAAMIGRTVEPVFAPIGFNWQISMALIPGMAAREVAVASLGTVYAVADSEEEPTQLGEALSSRWSLATALAFLAWYVFAPQCVATLGVIRRETNSRAWMWVSFGYMIALAYLAAFVTYQGARLLGLG
ncbi:ferrous iron transport protein B [Roseicella frigidaeris]|uniref:Ferrous iron transport protein B n=1 Tax=Roseicella frigidaeris TaxID=2230885 RepID=A0A327MF85_9PROT|nr:ferrous iron transport protein B [Roseicella frigidaeris]RAI60723.1 ferrous iron transport protein B [Roseicella frigidaeris]